MTHDEAELEARRRALADKLSQVEQQQTARHQASQPSTSDETAFGRGFRYSAEFAGGIFAGGLLGWLADRFLGLSPWGLVVGILLGFATGMYNLLKASERDRLDDLAAASKHKTTGE